ncbi:MAG: 50S ribosomal protein L19 [Clostridiaceae bacterium]|jgi:large subunit ribosomal protein L19|nr:50S ribosomal protein L19 [Clostridiaceae bacterium]
MDIIRALEQESMKKDLPNLKIGDYLRVNVKVKEGSRERIQSFEGTVIAMRGSGIRKTITVRRVSYGIGVERVFPIHSPKVASFEIIRRGKIRRAKLYYLRERVGKKARVKEDLTAAID